MNTEHECWSRLRQNTYRKDAGAVAAWVVANGFAIAAAVLNALFLVGCANVTDSKTNAQLIAPEKLVMNAPTPTANVWPASDWWKAFADPQLDALIDEALTTDGSPTLRLAQARLAKANAMANIAESATGITKTLTAASTREQFSENYIYPPPLGGSTYTINQLMLNFNLDLDFWGKNRAAIDSAHAQVRAIAADTEAARLALTTSVARTWFQLRRLYALREVAVASSQQREQVLTLTRQRATAGLDTVAELRQAEAAQPATRVDLGQIDEAIALTRNQLAALLGKGPEQGRSLAAPAMTATAGSTANAIALPDDLALNLLGRRADLVAARARVEAARYDIKQAQAQFYPNINLMASVGFLSLGASRFLEASSLNPSIGPALSLPLFNGTLRANLRGKAADYDAAVEQYNQTLIDAVKDVADQLTSLQAVQDQLRNQELARSKTEAAYNVALTRYEAGISNYLTVLNAQTSVFAQRRSETDLRARLLDTQLGLIRALGGGFGHAADTTAIAQG